MSATPPIGRRVRLLLLAVLAVISSAPLVLAVPAYACSCEPFTFEEAIDEADLIADTTFRGPVAEQDGEVIYDVVVHKVWKGEQARNIEVGTAAMVASCGLGEVPRNTDLLVWGSGADGRYSTTWCALPMSGGSDDRDRLTRTLGKPADLTHLPVAPEPLTMSRFLPVAVPVGAAVVITAVISLAVARSRRRLS